MAKLRILFDNFTLALLAVVAIATVFPCEGRGAVFFEWLTAAAIALLFFMHGACTCWSSPAPSSCFRCWGWRSSRC